MNLEPWSGREKLTVGTLVAVRFSEDGLIYRAKVTLNTWTRIWFNCSQVESNDDSVLTVRFIDYGNTEQKTMKEIFR